MKAVRKLTVLALAACFVGCGSLIPMKKSEQDGMKVNQQIATEHETTIRRALEPVIGAGLTWHEGTRPSPSPLPSQGEGMPMRQVVEIHDTASAAGKSHEEARAWYKQTIPMWVSLIGLGVGILVVFYAIRYARKSSAAVDAAWTAGDQAFARVIQSVRSKAMSTTDPQDLVKLNAHIAELEAERGKLAAA